MNRDLAWLELQDRSPTGRLICDDPAGLPGGVRRRPLGERAKELGEHGPNRVLAGRLSAGLDRSLAVIGP